MENVEKNSMRLLLLFVIFLSGSAVLKAFGFLDLTELTSGIFQIVIGLVLLLEIGIFSILKRTKKAEVTQSITLGVGAMSMVAGAIILFGVESQILGTIVGIVNIGVIITAIMEFNR